MSSSPSSGGSGPPEVSIPLVGLPAERISASPSPGGVIRNTPTPDRRVIPRRPIHERVEFAGAGVLEGWALNFSMGGVSVITEQSLPALEPFGVEVPTGRGSLRFLARVAWVREFGDGVVSGLCFERAMDHSIALGRIDFAGAGVATGWVLSNGGREIVVLTDQPLPPEGHFGAELDGNPPRRLLLRRAWAAERLGGHVAGLAIVRSLT